DGHVTGVQTCALPISDHTGLRLRLTRCLRGSRLYPAPAASWKLLHCSFLTRPAARSALARSSPGRLRPVCRGPPALPPPSCFLLAAQTTTAATSPRPFSGAALAPRKNAPSRRLEPELLPPGLPQAAAPPSPAAALPTAMICVSSDPSKMLLQSVDSASAATLSAQPQRPSAPSPAPSPAVS